MANIQPCCYPGCRDINGDPELTTDVICMRSRGRYRRVLDDLVGYYELIRDTMPMPQVSGGRAHSKPGAKTYGHPAEWASDRLFEVATRFHGWEGSLRAFRNDGDASPATSGDIRVRNGHHYLTSWFEALCEFPEAADAAEEFEEVHRAIRAGLGEARRVTRVAVPCPECDLRLLVRVADDYEDFIDCRNPECGVRIRLAEYHAWTQVKADEYLNRTDVA